MGLGKQQKHKLSTNLHNFSVLPLIFLYGDFYTKNSKIIKWLILWYNLNESREFPKYFKPRSVLVLWVFLFVF